MEKRLSAYEGHYPWWGHYRPRPDLRKLRFDGRSPGKKVSEIRRYVQLELLLEQASVLLHDRNAWDTSLIPGPVLYDESEEPAYLT